MSPYKFKTYKNGIRACENTVTDSNKLPMVFIHGMWGSAVIFNYWLYLCQLFGMKAHSIELRNHGEDKNLSELGRYSVNDYANDVSEVVSKIGPCVLCGWSMGGLICQLVAARNANVKKLVLVTSATPAGIMIRGKVLFRMWRYLWAFRGKAFRITPKDAVDLMANVGFTPSEQAEFAAMLNPESGRAAREMAFHGIRSERIECPVLIVGAEHDCITPTGMQRALAKKLRANGTNVLYAEIPGASHAIMLQQGVSKQTLKEIIKWVYGNTRPVAQQPKEQFALAT